MGPTSGALSPSRSSWAASANWQVLRNALPGRQIWALLQLVGTTCGEGSDSDVANFEARARREAEILGMTKDFESELELTDFVAPEVTRYFKGASQGR